MDFANLRREERIGLGIAVVLHVALAAAFLVQSSERQVVPPVEKMTVNLATDVGLEASAPEPVPESAAAIAPTLASEPVPLAVPEPAVQPRPEPPRPKPLPRATTAPKPTPPKASTEPRRRPDAPATTARAMPRPAGGSRIGSDFLTGSGDSSTSQETRVPASKIGASAKASIVQAISRQLKPKWEGRAPQGPDAEKLVTTLAFNLNVDGSLAGSPRVVSQSGVNELNRKQAPLHAEAAMKAVQLAAPFDLPEEYYEAWKRVSSFRFDRKL